MELFVTPAIATFSGGPDGAVWRRETNNTMLYGTGETSRTLAITSPIAMKSNACPKQLYYV